MLPSKGVLLVVVCLPDTFYSSRSNNKSSSWSSLSCKMFISSSTLFPFSSFLSTLPPIIQSISQSSLLSSFLWSSTSWTLPSTWNGPRKDGGMVMGGVKLLTVVQLLDPVWGCKRFWLCVPNSNSFFSGNDLDSMFLVVLALRWCDGVYGGGGREFNLEWYWLVVVSGSCCVLVWWLGDMVGERFSLLWSDIKIVVL